MQWERIECGLAMRGERYGEQWKSAPCISITKTGISFNVQAQEAFSIADGCRAHVSIGKGDDGTATCVGFKILTNGESTEGAATIRKPSAKNQKGLVVTSAVLAKRLKDFTGRAFKLKLQPAERMIVAELTKAPV